MGSAYAGVASASAVAPRPSTTPLPSGQPGTEDPGLPWVITLGGVDVSAVTLTGFTLDITIGAVPTASLTISDLDGLVTWPPDPVTELVVATSARRYFSGPVTRWQRKPLYGGGSPSEWEYRLDAEGWQRLLALSPVYPPGDDTEDYEGPDGTITSAVYNHGLGSRDLQASSISGAIETVFGDAWAGPPGVTFDMFVASGNPNFYIEPAGASIQSVVDTLIGGGQDVHVYWLDPDLVFHLWPCGDIWGNPYTPEPYQVAPLRLTTTPATGNFVPTILLDSYDGSALRSGVYGTGSVPSANTSEGTGIDYAGWEMTSAASVYTTGVGAAMQAYLQGRGALRRTVSVTLPPGSPAPGIAQFIEVDYPPVTTSPEYMCVRAVRGNLVVRGEGSGGMEWTLDLGDMERRSFVYEETLGQQASETAAPVAVKLEVGPVDQLLGLGSSQYIYAFAVDQFNNRVRLNGKSVSWSIWLNGSDIGGGGAGWTLSSTTTSVVFSPAYPLGFAYVTLSCDDPAVPMEDAVIVTAQLV